MDFLPPTAPASFSRARLTRPILTDCRSAAELRQEDSLVSLPAFEYLSA